MRAEEEGSRNRLAADSEPDFEPVEITPLCQTNDIFYANITYADLDQRLDILGFQRSEKRRQMAIVFSMQLRMWDILDYHITIYVLMLSTFIKVN